MNLKIRGVNVRLVRAILLMTVLVIITSTALLRQRAMKPVAKLTSEEVYLRAVSEHFHPVTRTIAQTPSEYADSALDKYKDHQYTLDTERKIGNAIHGLQQSYFGVDSSPPILRKISTFTGWFDKKTPQRR